MSMSLSNDNTLSLARTFAYPMDVIFWKYIDQDALCRWWWPHGNTNIFHEFHPIEWGKWTFTMQSDGVDYPNEMIFRKIENNHLILEHILPHFFLDISLDAISDNQTRMTWDMTWGSPEILARIREFLMEKNAENFDRLEEELKNF